MPKNEEILEIYNDLKNRSRGNLPIMYKTICSWINREVDGDNYARLNMYTEIKGLIEIAIAQWFMRENGYYYDEETHEWNKEPGDGEEGAEE